MTPPRPVTSVRAWKVRPDHHTEIPEHVATEEPMEIRVAGPGQEPRPVAVTMRTPGHDFELAAGFVVTEGVAAPGAVATVSYCETIGAGLPPGADLEASRYNVVTVRLNHPWTSTGPPRQFTATASCGICGKASIDDVEVVCAVVPPAPPLLGSLVPRLPVEMRAAQKAFDRTGGLHAAGLFAPDGSLRCVREDVGRHNAVDKVVGSTILGPRIDSSLAGWVLMVSGRVSFEIVQKAAVAGIGTIAAVSAPSSLAVTAAARLGLGLAGFVRDGSFNVYAHPERFDFDA